MPKIRTISSIHAKLRKRRMEWLAHAIELVDQIADWAVAEGWTVERNEKMFLDALLGAYRVPEMVVRLKEGELMVTPVAVGGDGRVDLDAIPTLSRVKLVIVKGKWKLYADANIPLYLDWNQANFTQLVQDLLR
jgi:hypothetical protein